MSPFTKIMPTPAISWKMAVDARSRLVLVSLRNVEVTLLLQYHPDSPVPYLWREPAWSGHASILSRNGAPRENPGRFNLDDDGAAQQDGELGRPALSDS
jgi:hypothetical protein